MSTGMLSLSPTETLARDRIGERVAVRHHVPWDERHARPHVRAARFLRSLADRLDPAARTGRTAAPELRPAAVASTGGPRPWSAEPRRTARRAPHRHS